MVDKERKREVAPEKEKNDEQPLAMLYLYRILYELTDENHGLIAKEIKRKLEDRRIHLDRPAILNYIRLLSEPYGLDIEMPGRGARTGYKMISREFELSELKLIIDAVAAARFIPQDEAYELIEKLRSLASTYQAGELKRHVYVANRVRAENKNIKSNIDWIHNAIENKLKIEFDYCEYTTDKKLIKRGKRRVCTPYSLAWSEDRYYLVASHPDYGIANYRVDRMTHVHISSEKADEIPEKYITTDGRNITFDLPQYLKTTFSMFSGEDEEVTLKFDKSLVNVVLDKFGYDTRLMPEDDGERFSIHVRINTEHPEPFFGWLFDLGTRAEIDSPAELKEKYADMLNKVLEHLRAK